MNRALLACIFGTVLMNTSIAAFAGDRGCGAGPRPSNYCTCTKVDQDDGTTQECVTRHTYELFADDSWIEGSTTKLICFGTADSEASADQQQCANFITSNACQGF